MLFLSYTSQLMSAVFIAWMRSQLSATLAWEVQPRAVAVQAVNDLLVVVGGLLGVPAHHSDGVVLLPQLTEHALELSIRLKLDVTGRRVHLRMGDFKVGSQVSVAPRRDRSRRLRVLDAYLVSEGRLRGRQLRRYREVVLDRNQNTWLFILRRRLVER